MTTAYYNDSFEIGLSILENLPVEIVLQIYKLTLCLNSKFHVQEIINMIFSNDDTMNYIGLLFLKECKFTFGINHLSITHDSVEKNFHTPYESCWFLSKLFELLEERKIILKNIVLLRELPDENFNTLRFDMMYADNVNNDFFTNKGSLFSNGIPLEFQKALLIRNKETDELIDCFIIPRNIKELIFLNSTCVGLSIEFHDLNNTNDNNFKLWNNNLLSFSKELIRTRYGYSDGICTDFRSFDFTNIKKIVINNDQGFSLIKLNDLPIELKCFEVRGICFNIEVPYITPNIEQIIPSHYSVQEVELDNDQDESIDA